jgi:uncharacterized membrane protein YqiK
MLSGLMMMVIIIIIIIIIIIMCIWHRGRVVKVARRLASMHTSETGLGSIPGAGAVHQAVHPFGVG